MKVEERKKEEWRKGGRYTCIEEIGGEMAPYRLEV